MTNAGSAEAFFDYQENPVLQLPKTTMLKLGHSQKLSLKFDTADGSLSF